MPTGRSPVITLLLALAALAAGGLALARPALPPALATLPWTQVAGTLTAILAAWLISRGIERTADGLHRGDQGWQRRLRQTLDVDADARLQEADWLAAILHLALWAALPLAVLHVWGLSEASLELLRRLAWTGFAVGEFRVVPAQILLGVLVLVALAAVIRWLSGRMEHRWLARTPMEPHTREAVATITGYALFVLAALAVLAGAGLDLSKLALIAGALSVGIGFGLQTIVNNFVSGLILLFEQPIRTGNYITVGDTEGFVRRIRIRATEIETLDRISVIVPNSELLTLHVKNWDLRDRFGRIICPVGVAYGSDVELVRRLLHEVAERTAQVVTDGTRGAPKPLVLFRGFGDSTLDFELRCVVRDITKRFSVASEINFGIDAAFREHGVTIAFPQRDVWFRNELPLARHSDEDQREA